MSVTKAFGTTISTDKDTTGTVLRFGSFLLDIGFNKRRVSRTDRKLTTETPPRKEGGDTRRLRGTQLSRT